MRKFIVYLFLMTTLLISQDISDSQKKLLEMSIHDLMQIKVTTANKSEERIEDVPASVIVLTREEIEKRGFQNFTEIIEHIPGIFSVDDYYWLGSQNFGVRGFFSTGPMNNMIILVNGIDQVSDKYSDYPDVKINVPIDAIDRIEIIKGPMSVIYGSGAFFGAINIITNSPENLDSKNLLSTSYGSLKTGSTFFRTQDKIENLEYVINVGYKSSAGIENSFSDITSDLSILEDVGLDKDATINGQKSEENAYFSLYMKNKNLFADISITENSKGVFDGQPNLLSGSELTTNAYNIVLGYNYIFNDKFKSKIKAGMYKHSHILNYEVFFKNYYEIDAQHTHSFDFEINNFYKPIDKIDINIGFYNRSVLDLFQISDFGYYNVKFGGGEIRLPENESYSKQSVYSQIKYNLNKNFKLIGGIRLDHLNSYKISYSRGLLNLNGPNGIIDTTNYRTNIYSEFNPDNNGLSFLSRLAAIYQYDKQVIKIMWGQASKQPSFSENYRQLPGNYPFPKIAKINTYELNYFNQLHTKLNINFSVFYNTLENLISTTNTYDSDTGEWDIYSYSSGEQYTIGTELGIDFLLNKKLKIKCDIMYQNSKNMKKGYKNIPLGYSPEILGYTTLFYNPTENFTVSFSGRYIGKIYTAWKTKTIPSEGFRIGNTIKAQYLLDLNFRKNNLIYNDLYCMLTIKNIFDIDRRYPTTSSNSWADKGTLGEPRILILTLGYKF